MATKIVNKIICSSEALQVIEDALELYYKLGTGKLTALNSFDPLLNVIPESVQDNFKDSMKANEIFWHGKDVNLGINSSEIHQSTKDAAIMYRKINLYSTAESLPFHEVNKKSNRLVAFLEIFDNVPDMTITFEHVEIPEETSEEISEETTEESLVETSEEVSEVLEEVLEEITINTNESDIQPII